MNSFCGLVVRTVARKTNSTVQNVANCLTFSRASINTHMCFRYHHLARSKSCLPMGYNSLFKHSLTAQAQDLAPSEGGYQISVRYKSRSHGNPHVKAAKKREQKAEEDSESDDEDESDEENEDGAEVWDKHFDEDDDFPERCKEINKRMNSLRCDALVSAGLATSRKKVEDFFLASQLYHNGQKILKAGKKAAEGDYIDVLEKSDGEPKVKRVRIVHVEKVEGQDKANVYLRCWRAYIKTDQYS